MSESRYIFPEAAKELLFLALSRREPEAIDQYLQAFSVRCGRTFMESLTHDASVVLFSDDELLERMQEGQQSEKFSQE